MHCRRSRASCGPAIVIEGEGLFDPPNPNVSLAPLTGDARLAIPERSLAIEPSPDNGCTTPRWSYSIDSLAGEAPLSYMRVGH